MFWFGVIAGAIGILIILVALAVIFEDKYFKE